MVWTILPPCTHWDANTHEDACARTHAHTHSVTIIRIDNARNLLRSGLNRDLCVRRLSLSLFPLPLRACRVSLDHSRCVSQSLTCTLSVLLYIAGTLSQKHTPIPISPTGPTYLLTFYHWVDTPDFKHAVTHRPASFILFFIFWR